MIHLLYGNDFLVREALAALRADLASSAGEMLESNTTVLDGAIVTPGELLSHAQAAPFLGGCRLVIAEGLLKHLTPQRGKKGEKKATRDGDLLEPWRGAAAQLADPAALPGTTTLVFIEGAVRADSRAFKLFATAAQTAEHRNPSDEALPGWIEQRARAKGVSLPPGIAKRIASTAGSDLWALDHELDKLAAYAGGAPVDGAMVDGVLTAAGETKVWDLTDAVVAGSERAALTALMRLLEAGEPPPMLASMLVREYRQMVHAKDLRERRARDAEIERVLDAKEWRVKRVGTNAAHYSWPELRAAYGRLVEADLTVKRGLQDDETSLQLLVHDLCALAASGAGAGRPRYAGASSSSRR